MREIEATSSSDRLLGISDTRSTLGNGLSEIGLVGSLIDRSLSPQSQFGMMSARAYNYGWENSTTQNSSPKFDSHNQAWASLKLGKSNYDRGYTSSTVSSFPIISYSAGDREGAARKFPSSSSQTIPNFTIRAEGTFTDNGGGDFDGDPRDPSDDALIYAGSGFTINRNSTLPVKTDAQGNPIRDNKGKLVLVDNAVAVAAGYNVINAPRSLYANLLPPQIVQRQKVNVPAYESIKQEELSRRISTDTQIATFNLQKTPINSASDWTRLFPASGTAERPTVVKIKGRGLNIPSNVCLSNTVIIVEQGDINFNGNGQNFNNVVLVANNGNINLSRVQANNLSVLASGSIQMNAKASFAGSTLLASGSSCGTINFNGSVRGNDACDRLRVISQGDIIYNSTAQTRGTFLSGKNFTTNAKSTIIGTIGAKCNVVFNAPTEVIAADNIPPAIAARLLRDTAIGGTNNDSITSDPSIVGRATDNRKITELKAGFDSTATSNYVNILDTLQADGSFTLNQERLAQIYGGNIPDGVHTLRLLTRDFACNTATSTVTFTLDTTTATPTLNLTRDSDTGFSNSDRVTKDTTPTLTGTAEAGSIVKILSGNQEVGQVTTPVNGTWQFTTPELTDGVYAFTAIATDIAGNVSPVSPQLPITIDTIAPKITLSTQLEGTVLNDKSRLTGVVDGTGSGIISLSYSFNNSTAVPVILNEVGYFDQALDLNGLSNGNNQLTITSTDIAGNITTQQYNLKVATGNTAPKFISIPETLYTIIRNPSPSVSSTPLITQPNLGEIRGQSFLDIDRDGTRSLSGSTNTKFSSIFLTGHDSDHHSVSISDNFIGARNINKAAINFISDPKYNSFSAQGINKFLFVESKINPPAGHIPGVNGIIDSGYVLNKDFELHDASTLDSELSQLGTKYSSIVVASDFGGTLTQSELDILNARSSDIIAFLNNGGGLYATAQSNNGAGLTPRGRFYAFLPFVVSSTAFNQAEEGVTVTDFGKSIGLTDADVNGNVSHNIFVNNFGLGVIDRDSNGNILSLAGRAKVGKENIFSDPGIDGFTIELINPALNEVIATQTTYSADLNKDGIINPITEQGLYQFSNLQPGTYKVREVIKNGWNLTTPQSPASYTINLTAGSKVSAYDFGNAQQYFYLAQAADADSDMLSYSIVSAPEGATISAETGKLTWTPPGIGQYTFKLKVEDGKGGEDIQSFVVNVVQQIEPPQITAGLARDTAPAGKTNNDQISFDPTIAGKVTNTGKLVSFRAGFDNTAPDNFVDVTTQVKADGSFTFDQSQLEKIFNGKLPDGDRTLKLQAKDEYGNVSEIFSFSFTLDTNTPTPTNLRLTPDSDTGSSNSDNITRDQTPTVIGNAEANASVQLFEGSQLVAEATVTSRGNWEITTNQLVDGSRTLTAIATDIAGNVSAKITSNPLTILVDTVEPQINLTTPINAVPLKPDTKLTGKVDGTGSAIATLSYRIDDGLEKSIAIDANGNFDRAIDTNRIADGKHTIKLTATDLAGNTTNQQYEVVVGLNTVPLGTLTGKVFSNQFLVGEQELPINASITADNHYRFYIGNSDGSDLKLIGTDTYNGGAYYWSVPETFSFTVSPDDHLYIVSWNTGGPRMWLGEFSLPNSVKLFSNDEDWQAAVGKGINPGEKIDIPLLTDISQEIATANWSTIAATLFNQPGQVWGQIPGISTNAEFTDYDSFFGTSSTDSTYVLYRTKTPLTSYFAEKQQLGIANQIVYLDNNQNGIRDENEVYTLTDAQGNYSLKVAPGVYTIAQEPQLSYIQVVPTKRIYQVTLNNEETVSSLDFINTQRRSHPDGNNTAPQFTSEPKTTAIAQQKFLYRATATDLDGDALFYELVVKPEGMTIDPVTGLVSWQPSTTQTGLQNVALKVEDGYGGEALQSFQINVRAANSAPVFTIEPPNESARLFVGRLFQYQFMAQDPEGDPISYEIDTVDDRAVIDPTTGIFSWTPTKSLYEYTASGNYPFTVTAKDINGAKTTLDFYLRVSEVNPQNTSPTITSTPRSTARSGNLYSYQIQATDPDGDPLTFGLVNPPTGAIVDAQTGLLTWTPTTDQQGDRTLRIKVTDGQGGEALQTATVTVIANSQNQAPVITSIPTVSAIANSEYLYEVKAIDPDNDQLTYTIDPGSRDRGITIDTQGKIRWIPTNNDVNKTYPVTITATDPAGANIQQTFNLTVTAPTDPDTEKPKVTLTASANQVKVGSDVTFQVKATDNVQVTNVQLLVNNQPVNLDLNNFATVNLDRLGTTNVKAIATDAAGNQGEQELTVLVGAPSTQAPNVSLNLANIPNGEITSVTDIIGTVDDPDSDVVSYKLEVAPVNGGEFKTIAQGQKEVVDKVLGQFDPSLLVNDAYTLRLTAIDESGNSNFVEDTVSITQELKLGNFQLSFTDISIPVAGIPITLTRTYDTLTSNTSDDFGFGWRMEFRDTDLRTSLGRDALLEEDGVVIASKGFTDKTRVYITLPGGKRETFIFKPRRALSNLFQPAFSAEPGSTSTLTVQGGTIIRGADGQYLASGSLYNPAVFGGYYELKTKEGIVYRINATTGDLETVTDTNGNKLTFTDSEITSSTGAKVTFTRDAQGRIVTATDMDGKQVKYEYNAQGDLIAVSDRDGNTTKLEYNPRQAHYLDKVIDPLNRSVVRNEYDENGRLKGLKDAAGNGIGFSYDPNNQLEVITDPSGNKTTREYDERGNVVQIVDASGGITRNSYDANNNLLTTTNALGYTTTYTYDAQGNRLTETDALGNKTTNTYNANGNLLTSIDPSGNVTAYTYNSRGELQTIKDPKGNVSEIKQDDLGNVTELKIGNTTLSGFSYDRNGRVSQQIDANGGTTSYTYDNNGRVITENITVTTANGPKLLTTRYEYDNSGRVIAVSDRLGNTSRTEYDQAGRISATIDSLGRRTEYTYDAANNRTAIKYPDGSSESFQYDAVGNQTASTDRAGRTTYYVYDKLGRRIATILPDATPNDLSDNPLSQTEYDAIGQVKAEIGVLGDRSEYTYDAVGRRTKVKDALGNETTYTYNANGATTSVTDALGQKTEYVYNQAGDLTEIIYADGTREKRDPVNTNLTGPIEVKDGFGNITKYSRNALNQITAVVDALGQRTEYAYDEIGNLVQQKDAKGNITKYEYDGLGRRTATILPEGQRSTSSYDAFGRIITYTDFNGQTFKYEYDLRDRLVKITNPDGTIITNTYTASDRIASTVDSNGTTTYTYDVGDRVTGRKDPDGRSIGYGYDIAGRRTSITSAASTTTYSYDLLNRLTQVNDSATGITKYTYNALSNLIQTDLPNNVRENRQYDIFGRLNYLEQRNTTSDLVLDSYRYSRDANGNVTKVSENNGRVVSYQYDKLNRLTQEAIAGDRTVGYTYDAVGNRLTRNDSVTGLSNYTYDLNNRLISNISGGVTTTYTYDANGNQLSETNANRTATYQWNASNQLTGVVLKDGSGNIIRDEVYKYNSQGIRIAQIENGQETRYLIDDSQPYAQVREEYKPDGTLISAYTHDGLGQAPISQNRDGLVLYYLGDRQDSVRELTNVSGNVTDQYIYDAYGRVLKQVGSSQNSYLYTGEHFDAEIGLEYLRARYLNTVAGQFISRDSLEGIINQPLSLNLYNYAQGNPVSFIDPSGNFISVAEILTSVRSAIQLSYVTLAEIGPAWNVLSKARAFGDFAALFAFGSLILTTALSANASLPEERNKFEQNFVISRFLKGYGGKFEEGTVELSKGSLFKELNKLEGTLKIGWKIKDKPNRELSFGVKDGAFILGSAVAQEIPLVQIPDNIRIGIKGLNGSLLDTSFQVRGSTTLRTGGKEKLTKSAGRVGVSLRGQLLFKASLFRGAEIEVPVLFLDLNFNRQGVDVNAGTVLD